MDDAVEQIIACARTEEVDDPAQWMSRHEEQSEDGEVAADEVNVSGGDAFCVSYEPGVDLDIVWPEKKSWGEGVRDTLRDHILTGTYGRVQVPARVGCDEVFGDYTDYAMFDGQINDAYHMAYTTICIPPEDFLRIQYQLVADFAREDFEEWLLQVSDDRVEAIEESITDRDREWPRPPLLLDNDGHLIDFQEGRHRGLAAWNADVPLMDVYVFCTHRRDDGQAEYKFGHPPVFPQKGL